MAEANKSGMRISLPSPWIFESGVILHPEVDVDCDRNEAFVVHHDSTGTIQKSTLRSFVSQHRGEASINSFSAFVRHRMIANGIEPSASASLLYDGE